MGAFHTLDLELQRDVRIEKADGWDSVARARVEEAIIPGKGAEVGAVVCGEGTAAFCLLSQHMTVVVHRVSVPVPRKSASPGTSQYEKGLQKFYATVYDSFVRHIPYANMNLRAIVLASPGWVRDNVYNHMVEEARKRGDKGLSKVLKEKVLRVHVNSPHVHSLMEVLKSPEVRKSFEFPATRSLIDELLGRSYHNSKRLNLPGKASRWTSQISAYICSSTVRSHLFV
jgi:protein pelota